jgi:1-acyl-sn-glycerol-3-phosphate acyltransferase
MFLWIARAVLFIWGWKPEGERPSLAKYVVIAAPHTTNWDFPFTIAICKVMDIKIRWMGKQSLFAWPFGGFMRRMGGIPVNRERSSNVVKATAEGFKDFQELALLVPAEGTRSRVEYWKSGFYHIAREANVPIVPAYLDYKRKRGGFGEPILPSGNIKQDMDRIRAFYEGRIGKYPENFGPIRLKEETDASAVSPKEADRSVLTR